MKSLGIITINQGRKKILSLWLAQIQRLRRETQCYIPAVVVSDDTDEALCHSYHVVHIPHNNFPVTAKWNRALKYMRSEGVDYIQILGSDDIVSTMYIQKTLERMEQGIDLIGTETIYFYCGQGAERGKLVKLDTPILKGIGKTVSKRILDQCDWMLWNVEKNWGMDAIATKTIMAYNPSKAVIEGIVVDVKTKENLNSFRVFRNRQEVDNGLFFNILSEEEKLILNSL
jgi:glycosyltransferase involved in cell wall biosynthesis